LHWYEVPKMRNRDGHKETKGKKASVLFLPKLSLQSHIKDMTNRLVCLLFARVLKF
jgi:hypothetical protein